MGAAKTRESRTTIDSLEPTADAAWVLVAEGYDELRESTIGSRFAIGNGFLGIRGARALTSAESDIAPARTYVAGLFDTPNAAVLSPGLVQAADWLQVRLSLGGEPLIRHPGDVAAQRRMLDMRCGVVLSEGWFGGPEPGVSNVGIRGRSLRLVSLHARGLGLELIELETHAGEVELTLSAAFEGADLDLAVDRLSKDFGIWSTRQTATRLMIATTCSLFVDGKIIPPTTTGDLQSSWTWRSRPGQVASFERLVSIAKSSQGIDELAGQALRDIAGLSNLGSRKLLASHEKAWAERWRLSEMSVDGDAPAQRALRFAGYHLNSAANPDDDRVSIAARALTGDDYRGHVFWDTEIYLLPFYTMTWPRAARSLLMYRFHTLAGARAKAKRLGWRGALYAWESADTGEETTPEEVIGPDRKVVKVLGGLQEQHISADVAYAVWQYWQATADEGFLCDAGAEIILETARFWASRAKLEGDGRRHIRGVIGPDEYHEDIDDNAFTNVMARWNLRQACEVVTLMRERWPDRWAALSRELDLGDAELAEWRSAADAMVSSLDPATGLFEQFAGYNTLEQIDLAQYSGRSVPMDVVLGRERIQKTQVVKQADVVALIGLLPGEFTGDMALRNFQFYAPRCSHGSSLSRVMHGLVAARLGLADQALGFFRDTSEIDLGDTHVAIDGGIHIAALGGLWTMAVLGFAGLSMTETGVALDPHLPSEWKSLRFSVQWRGRTLSLHLQPRGRIDATLLGGTPMTILVGGRCHELATGKPLEISTASGIGRETSGAGHVR